MMLVVILELEVVMQHKKKLYPLILYVLAVNLNHTEKYFEC